LILIKRNIPTLVKRFYEIGENPINYNDLIIECKDNINLNETSVDTIKQLHEVVLEDVYESLNFSAEVYLDRFIDHVIINLAKNLNIASRREKQNTDDKSNFIPTETILFLKSLILCCLNEELDSIFCLSKLYLSNKIKFDSCYKMAKQIFDSEKEYSNSDDCKINFYLLFSDYDSCVKISEKT